VLQDGEAALLARRAALAKLTLSNEAIARREDDRIREFQEFIRAESARGLGIAASIRRQDTPWFVMAPYKTLCYML
jgi:hypothetical protein